MATPTEKEKLQFTVYCDREFVERLELFGKKFGMSRNEVVVFFLESGFGPVEKMDKSGVLKFLNKVFSRRKKALASKVLGELA